MVVLLFTGITLPSAGEGRKGRKGYRLHSGPGYFRDRPKLFLDVLSDQPKSEDNADPKRKAKVITVFPSVLKFSKCVI